MKLKGIINVDGGEDDKDIALEKSYSQLKNDEGKKKTYLGPYNEYFGDQQGGS